MHILVIVDSLFGCSFVYVDLKDGEAYWLCEVTEVVLRGNNKGNFKVQRRSKICSGLFDTGAVVPLGRQARPLHAAQGQLPDVAYWRPD